MADSCERTQILHENRKNCVEKLNMLCYNENRTENEAETDLLLFSA